MHSNLLDYPGDQHKQAICREITVKGKGMDAGGEAKNDWWVSDAMPMIRLKARSLF